MKSQFVDPVTINSKEDVITFQNTGSKCHVPEMKRHSPCSNKSSFSPPESTSALSSAPEQVDNYLWPNLEKQHRDKFYPGKKINFFNSSPERIKYFSELYFYWENDEKIMEKSVFICQMIHVCVIGGISQSSC